MTAMEHFQRSDTLQITNLSFEIHSPAGIQSGSVPPFCKTKGGPLAITLLATDVGLPVPGLRIDFTGTPSADQTQITWSVAEDIDIWVTAGDPPVPVHLTRVAGQITTSVDDAMPSLTTTCDGRDDRLILSALTTVGNANLLVVETSVGNIRAQNLALTALAGETAPPLFFRVGVSCSGWLEDGCGMKFQAPETDVMFSALVQGLIFRGTLISTAFEWTVSGPASIPGDPHQQSVTLHIDDVGIVSLKVKVTVATDVEVSSVERTVTFAVFDDESARLLRSLCHLRQQFGPRLNRVVRGVGSGFTAGGVKFVDPLWDPTPDLAAAANSLVPDFSLLDLVRLQSQTEHFGHVAGAISKGLKEILSKKGFASAFVSQASSPNQIANPKQ